MQPPSNVIKDLGYANGWMGKVPEEVKKCRKLKHPVSPKELGRSLNQYTCKVCGYAYKIDSGD